MSNKIVILAWGVFSLTGSLQGEEDWIRLFNGHSLQGWEANEHQDSWSVGDSAIIANGPRSHLFYMGEHQPFRNFILRVEVYTERWSNGGIYFLTAFQSRGWPEQGFEAQVNNSYIDWKKTGSLYGIDDVLFFSPASDRQWWTQEIMVDGRHILIKINGKTVVDHMLREAIRPEEGTIALQAHDRKSVVKYRNIRIKRLQESP